MFCIIIIFFIVLILTIVFDYCNMLGRFGVNIQNLNMDILSIFIGNIIVICISLITYLLIERNNLIKTRNQRDVAILILKHTYSQCKQSIDEIYREEDLNNSLYARCKLNKMKDKEELTLDLICNLPFEYDAYILSLANNGNVYNNELNAYFEIKSAYKEYIIHLYCFDCARDLFTTKGKELFNETSATLKNDIITKIHNQMDNFDI